MGHLCKQKENEDDTKGMKGNDGYRIWYRTKVRQLENFLLNGFLMIEFNLIGFGIPFACLSQC